MEELSLAVFATDLPLSCSFPPLGLVPPWRGSEFLMSLASHMGLVPALGSLHCSLKVTYLSVPLTMVAPPGLATLRLSLFLSLRTAVTLTL